MSEFIARITAELDVSAAEKQLQNLTKDQEVNIKVNLTGDLDGFDFSKLINKQLSEAESAASKAGKNVGKVYNTALQTQIETMAKTQKNAFSEPLDNMTKEQQSYISWWEKSISKQTRAFSQLDATIASNKTLTWLKNNSAAAKDYGDVLRDLASKQRTATNADDLKIYTKQVNAIKTEAASLGKTGKSITEELTRGFEQIGQFAVTYGIIQNVVSDIPQKMISAVYEIDTAMTNLYKVTDETATRYDQFLTDAGTKAKELGRSMSSYIEQTAEWSKLGYTFNQSEELAKVSSIYANVGEVDDATAVSDIVTTMKAFNIESSNAIDIIDQLNILGNNFATSSADLGEGLQKSASAMNTAGTDLNHTLAMLTGGAEITQSAGEFGNFLKVASMRIRGMKGELEELGEEVGDSVDSISKVQTQILNLTHGKVNIFDSSGEFRDYYEIMEEISAIHDELSSTEQASLDELLFGKQRANQGAALIQAFQSGQIQKALESTYNAEGSAMQEQERLLESLEAKVQQFQAAFQELSNTVISSDFLKGIVDLGTSLLEVITSLIDNFGVLQTLIGGFAIGKGLTTFIKGFDKPTLQLG